MIQEWFECASGDGIEFTVHLNSDEDASLVCFEMNKPYKKERWLNLTVEDAKRFRLQLDRAIELAAYPSIREDERNRLAAEGHEMPSGE